MPIYEYRCHDCEHVFEELVLSASLATQVRCEKCRSSRVEKLLSAFAVNAPGPAGAPKPKKASGSGPCGAHCACHGS